MWIDIKTASKRSGLTPRQVRRLASEIYSRQGKARLINTDGKPHWEIDETADHRFARIRLPYYIEADLRQFREKDRQLAYQRFEILQAWQHYITDKLNHGLAKIQATDAFIAEYQQHFSVKISRPTLYRWEKQFRYEGIKGLVPKRANIQELNISDEAITEFRRLYLDLRQPSIKSCYQQVAYLAAQNGWNWFNSLRSCQRWASTTFTKPELILNRHGKKAYDAICSPYLQRDPQQWAGNECWVGDHHQLDLWAIYQGKLIRPWLTAWQDMRSRVIVGWVLSPSPNQSTILLAFRNGCLNFGPPSHVYMDNGKDYDSYAFTGQTKAQRKKALKKGYIDEALVQGLFGQLGITVTFAIPYNPQSKPIERTFRTIEEQFCKTFITYCGNTPFSRPENLQKILDNKQGIPDLATIETKLGNYIDNVYHTNTHTGIGMNGAAPLEVMHNTQVVKRVADNRVLDLMLAIWSQPITVGKHGIRFKNINYGSMQPELIAMQGQKIRVAYDPMDVSQVTIWTLDGKFICRAKATGLISGLKDEHLRQAMRTKRQIARSLKQADNVRHIAHRDITELAIAAASNSLDSQNSETPILQPIKTDLEAALMQRLNPLKQAVGNEFSITDDRLFNSLDDEQSVTLTPNIDGRLLKLADE